MRYCYLFIFFLLSFSTAYSQDALTQEISYAYLDKLIEAAKKNYPKLKVYQSKVDAGEYATKRAKLSYFEIISLSYLYSPNQTASTINPNFLNGYQFGFFINVGAILQKPSLIKQARHELKALEHDRDAYEVTIEADVRRRYIAYMQFKMLLRVRTAAWQDVELTATDLKFKYEKSEVSLQDYNTALVTASDRMEAKIEAEANMLMAKASLEELVGQKLEDIQ
jgi:outer membrane protein TolC